MLGRLDFAQVFFRIFTATVEHLNFTEHSQLLQIFTGLYIERILIKYFIDKVNRNLKSYSVKLLNNKKNYCFALVLAYLQKQMPGGVLQKRCS